MFDKLKENGCVNFWVVYMDCSEHHYSVTTEEEFDKILSNRYIDFWGFEGSDEEQYI